MELLEALRRVIEVKRPLAELFPGDKVRKFLMDLRCRLLDDSRVEHILARWRLNTCPVCGQKTYVAVKILRGDLPRFACLHCKILWPMYIFYCYYCHVEDPDDLEFYVTDDYRFELVFHLDCRRYVRVLNLKLSRYLPLDELFREIENWNQDALFLDEYARSNLGLVPVSE